MDSRSKSITFQSITIPSLGRSGYGSGSSDGLRTPMRCLRLFVFAFLLPCALIAVPLYQRNVTLAPRVYTLTASDMRAVQDGISRVWCEAQELASETPFTSYRTDGPLPQHSRRQPVTLRHKLTLTDDVREFWGFYLLRGSRISVSACARWPGTSLLVVHGWEALNECVWVGQVDSIEEESSEEEEDEEDVDEAELDPVRRQWWEFLRRHPRPTAAAATGHSEPVETPTAEHSLQPAETPTAGHSERPAEAPPAGHSGQPAETPTAGRSVQPVETPTAGHFVQSVETPTAGHSERPAETPTAEHSVQPVETPTAEHSVQPAKTPPGGHSGRPAEAPTAAPTDAPPTPASREPPEWPGEDWWGTYPTSDRAHVESTAPAKMYGESYAETQLFQRAEEVERTVEKELGEADEAVMAPWADSPVEFTQHDSDDRQPPPKEPHTLLTNTIIERKIQSERRRRRRQATVSDATTTTTAAPSSAQLRASRADRMIPLTYNGHRGRINQSLSQTETSHSEMMSSFSSSEEKLINCQGVIINQPLLASVNCSEGVGSASDPITVQIIGDNYYYLVFYSENELLPVDVFFDVTLDKTVYDVRAAEAVCTESTRCHVPLGFWSSDSVVLEYPVGGNASEAVWSEQYTVRSSCQSRGWVVAVFVVAALCSLFVCAFC